MEERIKKIIITIEGMDCVSCAGGIEGSLSNLDGVAEANVNYANGKAFVSYDPETISAEELLNLIEKLGYKGYLADESGVETVSLAIKGMTCTNCAAGIEKKLRSTGGIVEANINFASEKGLVKYQSDEIRLREIKEIVHSLGYEAVVADEESEGESPDYLAKAKKKMIYASLLTGLVMFLMTIRMLGLIIPAYHLLTVIIGFPVVFVLGAKVHKSSWNSLKNRSTNMDVLVSLGSLPPFIIGLSGFFFEVQTFIEMATTIMTFHLIGKYLETRAKGRSSEAIKKLIQLGAKTAKIEQDGKEIEVAVKELERGDLMIIRPGEKIPIDGQIVEGSSTVDESMVTGESIPVVRSEGDEVIGATINKQGYLKVRVTKTGKDTFLAQVIKLVEECQGSKVPIQDFSDRVTGYFVPAIIGITILTFISYNIFPGFHRAIIEWGAGFLPWVNPELSNLTLAFITATAVLVIACPCALGLGTPTALMVGSGLGAENGILIRNGEAVQTLREIKAVAFDKTGTITYGKPEVTDVITYNGFSVEELFFYAGSLEKSSEHPLASAILDETEKRGVKLEKVTQVEANPGKGISGVIEEREVLAGNKRMLDDFQVEYSSAKHDMLELEEQAKTLLLVVVDKKLAGLIAVADKIKEDSAKAIQVLEEMGISTIMITGDNEKTAQAIARKAGIERVIAEVLPDGKVKEIIKLQQEYGLVAMVGDGINDAPALKQANIGIALGTGTDVAIEAADVTLVRGELINVVAAIKLSRAIFRKIKENFFWAWFYNLVAVPMAVLGLLHPMIGAAAMSVSSLNVVYNSLRLKKVKLS